MTVETNKLFVGNLDHRIRWFHLKEFFGKYGEVTYTKVVYDRETRRSRGFGFVVFADDEWAANALENANGAVVETEETSFPDRPVRLMYAEKKEEATSEEVEELEASEEETEE